MELKKFIFHVRTWNTWRKWNTNSWFYKILVLLGFMHSPSLDMVPTIEQTARDYDLDIQSITLTDLVKEKNTND